MQIKPSRAHRMNIFAARVVSLVDKFALLIKIQTNIWKYNNNIFVTKCNAPVKSLIISMNAGNKHIASRCTKDNRHSHRFTTRSLVHTAEQTTTSRVANIFNILYTLWLVSCPAVIFYNHANNLKSLPNMGTISIGYSCMDDELRWDIAGDLFPS